MCEQATESSLKRMHQRMQEAEQRMMRDNVTADNMLQIVGTEEFPRPRGVLIPTSVVMCPHVITLFATCIAKFHCT